MVLIKDKSVWVMIIGIVVGGVALSGVCCSKDKEAESKGINLNARDSEETQNGPFYPRITLAGTPGAVYITWNTLKANTSIVQYGTQKNTLNQIRVSHYNASADKSFGFVHAVKLENLLPMTQYHYRIGISKKAPVHLSGSLSDNQLSKIGSPLKVDSVSMVFSKVYTFKTARIEASVLGRDGQAVTDVGSATTQKKINKDAAQRETNKDTAWGNNTIGAVKNNKETEDGFAFVMLGDTRFGGTDGKMWQTVLAAAAAEKPAFILNSGDIVDDGGKSNDWLDWLKKTGESLAQIPMMPVLGNHDIDHRTGDAPLYREVFTLIDPVKPTSAAPNDDGVEDYYYFVYDDMIVVSLSTITHTGALQSADTEGSADGNVKSKPFGKQAVWLDRVLTQNPKKWKVVSYHHPSYTQYRFAMLSASHGPNFVGQNAAFVPIIDKHNVDMVLTGHNHWYERFHASACAKKGIPNSDEPCPVTDKDGYNGTVYLVSGGGGAPLKTGINCDSQPGGAMCKSDYHYILAKIKDETLTLEAKKVSTNGPSTDAGIVIDSVVIRKKGN